MTLLQPEAHMHLLNTGPEGEPPVGAPLPPPPPPLPVPPPVPPLPVPPLPPPRCWVPRWGLVAPLAVPWPLVPRAPRTGLPPRVRLPVWVAGTTVGEGVPAAAPAAAASPVRAL